jgi:hypothetical protein
MTHQNLRPLFEDPSAPSELRNFVALARGDGPSQADLDRLATRVGRAIGVSAGVLVASSVANATALSTPPAQLVAATQPGLAKLGVLGKLLASGSGKLLAVGLSAGIGVGVWAYGRPQHPAHDAHTRGARPAPVAEPASAPEATQHGSAQGALAPAAPPPAAPGTPVPIVTPLASERVRAAPGRSGAGRPAGRRAPAAALAAPVKEEELVPSEPASQAELPSELSLIQQAEAARDHAAQALQLLAEHERLYPRGALAQEREVLAIELLLKIGKPDQARARAERFERSHPSSAHLPRVRALLARADDE